MKVLIFLGSVRESTPPKPARLGERVALACEKILKTHFSEVSVEIIDPLKVDLNPIFKPHFAYAPSAVPQALDIVAEKIKQADAYVMVSPEYNHSMSPALAHILNHFGASLFSYKPSVIVTYSAGQWGGARASVGMRTFLGELGCLPVSAMIHIPKAHEVLDMDGGYQSTINDVDRWDDYFMRGFLQLQWWANATKRYRSVENPHNIITDFKRQPSQRNAPSGG